MKTYTIYKHTNIINGKSYIGLTCQKVTNRWKNGFGYTKETQPVFYSAIQKYGWENFSHEILEKEIPTLEQANQREQYWIAYYHTWVYDPYCNGYNTTQGGDGNLGHKVSDEARLQMSKSHQGQQSWAKGKTFSEEHRRHLSESKRGKPRQKHSEETKQKMSEAAKGRPRTAETCKKISESKKGSIPWNKGKQGLQTHVVSEEVRLKIAQANGILVECLDQDTNTITYYHSISEAIRQLQPHTTSGLTYQFRQLTQHKCEYILIDHYKIKLKNKENS